MSAFGSDAAGFCAAGSVAFSVTPLLVGVGAARVPGAGVAVSDGAVMSPEAGTCSGNAALRVTEPSLAAADERTSTVYVSPTTSPLMVTLPAFGPTRLPIDARSPAAFTVFAIASML